LGHPETARIETANMWHGEMEITESTAVRFELKMAWL